MHFDPREEVDQKAPAAIGGQSGISSAQIVALADQIDQLGSAFADMQRQLAALTAQIRAMAQSGSSAEESTGAGVSPPEEPLIPDDPWSAWDAPRAFADEPRPRIAAVASEPASRTDTAPAPSFPAEVLGDPTKAEQLAEILQYYRDLIAQPVKSEINRWIDQAGGLTCEVADDDRFHLPSGDTRGLLALLPLSDQSAIVVPAGRLVVDFTSSFANVIAMRTVTRTAFDLVGGGGGRLQLIEPAYATFSGGEWRLERAGKLGGFSAD